ETNDAIEDSSSTTRTVCVCGLATLRDDGSCVQREDVEIREHERRVAAVQRVRTVRSRDRDPRALADDGEVDVGPAANDHLERAADHLPAEVLPDEALLRAVVVEVDALRPGDDGRDRVGALALVE